MNKLALVALSIVFGCAAAPALAADSEKGGLEKAVDGGLVVTRVGGLGASLVVGTPVAIVRDTLHHYTTWTPDLADKMGSKDCGPSMAVASLATVPASLVWGTVTGTFHGSKNAFVHGFNEPFSPKSFSLGSDYEQ